ncbi:MAG: hypothetical protein JWP74_503 [Marmoricola sp.]|nr:hypothetical protein [Marmoricola sp.]
MTAEIGGQIAEHRDKLTETIGGLADQIDTSELRSRAESGASELLDSAGTKDGKRGLIIGAVITLGVLVLVRRLLS